MRLHYRDLPADRFSFFYSHGQYNYQAVKNNTPMAEGGVSSNRELDLIAGELLHQFGISEVYFGDPDGSYSLVNQTLPSCILNAPALAA